MVLLWWLIAVEEKKLDINVTVTIFFSSLFCFGCSSSQMWCARYGHLECGIILAQWSPESLQKRDNEGLNPVQIAVARGFVKCASELEKIQTSSRATPAFPQSFDSEDFSLSE